MGNTSRAAAPPEAAATNKAEETDANVAPAQEQHSSRSSLIRFALHSSADCKVMKPCGILRNGAFHFTSRWFLMFACFFFWRINTRNSARIASAFYRRPLTFSVTVNREMTMAFLFNFFGGTQQRPSSTGQMSTRSTITRFETLARGTFCFPPTSVTTGDLARPRQNSCKYREGTTGRKSESAATHVPAQ